MCVCKPYNIYAYGQTSGHNHDTLKSLRTIKQDAL